jgi:hypothetical protein
MNPKQAERIVLALERIADALQKISKCIADDSTEWLPYVRTDFEINKGGF